MRRVLDLIYGAAALVASPFWMTRMIRTGRIRTDWRARFGIGPIVPDAGHRPRILIHAVSVGEVNAVRTLVDALLTEPDAPETVIAATTDTGFARARELFSDRCHIVRYPFDFSFAVDRFLDRVRPDLVLLVELEVWPNFTAACERRSIPLCVVNGRLSERSFRRYRLVRPFVRRSFERLRWAAVQSDAYAERFRSLGTRWVHVVGTMKWDTARIEDEAPGAAELAEALGIDRSRPLVVGGSTARGEHELLVASVPQGVQLLCAPRKPEWFDEAARALPGCARRSRGDRGSETGRFLLDTIGELRQAYALADVVVVGRSFGRLHGSDMIEPVALGKATIVGPAVGDFQEACDAILAGGGLIQTSRDELAATLRRLLASPRQRQELAERGREVIRRRQGSTERHIGLIRDELRRLQTTERKFAVPAGSRNGEGGERRKSS